MFEPSLLELFGKKSRSFHQKPSMICSSVPKTKSRFWEKKNQNFGAKMQIWGFSTSLISNFQVSEQDSKGIGEINFGFLEMDFRIPNVKFAIEFQILRCRFCIFQSFDVAISCFSGIQILKTLKFQILAEWISAFSLNFDSKFRF